MAIYAAMRAAISHNAPVTLRPVEPRRRLNRTPRKREDGVDRHATDPRLPARTSLRAGRQFRETPCQVRSSPPCSAFKRATESSTAVPVLASHDESSCLEARGARVKPRHHDLRVRGVLEAVIRVLRHEDGLAWAELDGVVVDVRDAMPRDELLNLFGVRVSVNLVTGSGREGGHAEDRLLRPDALAGYEPPNIHIHPAAFGYSGIGRGTGDGDLVRMLIDCHEIKSPV